MNPRCPPGSLSIMPAVEPVETTGGDLPAKDLPAAEEGLDTQPESSTRLDEGPKVVAEG